MTSKEEREAANFKKRDDFYKELQEVNFNFDSQKVTLQEFKNGIMTSLGNLEKLCTKKVSEAKGYETKKRLNLIIKNAEELKNNAENIDLSALNSGKPLSTDLCKKVLDGFKNLAVAFKGASEAHYPSLINQSTLDYTPTREYLLDLGRQLTKCKVTFLALVDEAHGAILIEKLKQTKRDPESLRVDWSIIIPNLGEMYFGYCNNNDQIISYRCSLVNTSALNNLLQIFENIKAVRDFSKQLQSLRNIKSKFYKDELAAGNTYICDGCGKKSKNTSFLVTHCSGSKEHWLCINCLKKASSTRFHKFKCPKCGASLKKDVVLAYIGGRSKR